MQPTKITTAIKTRSGKRSSGKKRVSVASKSIRRLKAKIKRFERYQQEGKKGKPSNQSGNKKWKSKRDLWKTDGLKKELKRQEELLERGPKIA